MRTWGEDAKLHTDEYPSYEVVTRVVVQKSLNKYDEYCDVTASVVSITKTIEPNDTGAFVSSFFLDSTVLHKNDI